MERLYVGNGYIESLRALYSLSIFILQPAALGFDDGREASGWPRIEKKKRIAKIVVVMGAG